MSFDTLGLAPDLLRAIADKGYTEPTPIQQQAIPAVLARRDIMGSAQTGTGKTASFALPILQLLMPQQNTSPSPARHPVRALALTPTRELAVQVQDSFRDYGKYLALRSTTVYGGVDIAPQTKALRDGVEIVVATPGRLLDHVQQKTINLARVELLVLDEADRMLDMGFMPDIKRILALLPAQRQNLLFSATFSDDIKKLCEQLLRNPISIEIARRNSTNELVTHSVYEVETEKKRTLLTHLIRSRNLHQVLVFTRTKKDADKLARELARDGIATAAIHSDRSQAERMKALDDFKNGTVNALVATDIAARGLDIEQLPFVVNYELPFVAEDYVHRIGRTGRAGYPGEAVSLVSDDETKLLAEIEKLLKREIPRLPLPALQGASRGERRHEQRDRHFKTPAPTPAAATSPQNAGFDFSRPYEAAEKEEPARNDTTHHAGTASARKPGRPVAALLGGFASKKS